MKNYGIFWERSLVEWGGRGAGNFGNLNGAQRSSKSRIVDFSEQAGIYVLYEGSSIAEHRVTYIGQAGGGQKGLLNRLRAHQKDHLRDRWQRFSWFGIYAVGARDTLIHAKPAKKVTAGTVFDLMNHVEGILVALMEPLLNKQGPRFKDSVDEYLQASASQTRLDQLEEKIDDILELVRAAPGRKKK